MVDYKKRVEAIIGSASVIIGSAAIVLGLASQIYLNHSLKESLKSPQQRSYSTSESYQQWEDSFQRETEFYLSILETGSVMGALVEMAERRGLVEIVECNDDTLVGDREQ